MGESDPLEEQQRLDPLLHSRHFTDQRVTELGEVAKLSINRRRHVNALQLSTAQVLRQAAAVESIGFTFALELWESSTAPPPSKCSLGPSTHHTIRTRSVQPRRRMQLSVRENACARG